MENVKVKDRFTDKKTGIEYIKQGDYYLSNLVLSPEKTNYTIGKYGRMKLNYLKNNKKAEYIILFMDSKLNRYLHEVDIACEDRVKTIISQLVKQENVTEERKADLINRNEEYKELREKFNDIMNKYPNLQLILEDREMILDETECKMLQKLATIYIDICDFEEKEIFLLGGKEMYFYLKDTGVIKEK